MRNIGEQQEIFNNIANSVNWTKTNSIEKADKLLKKLIYETKGDVIIDFLDSGCWDYIQGIESDIDEGFIKLIWKDYTNKNESEKEKQLRREFFPASIYSLSLKFKEIRIIKGKDASFFLIRGFALKDKEIKKYFKMEGNEVEIVANEDNFSKLVVIKKDELAEVCHFLNTPIFSMVIIPKDDDISEIDSKKLLFAYNLTDSLTRLEKIRNELDKNDLIDEDIICEKANTIRRVLEYVLKVELCYRYRYIKKKPKDYSDLMLGDLIKLVNHDEQDKNEMLNNFLQNITLYSNQLSHDSGKPIEKATAHALCYMTILYTTSLKSEIIK